jgi:hypothetical protein
MNGAVLVALGVGPLLPIVVVSAKARRRVGMEAWELCNAMLAGILPDDPFDVGKPSQPQALAKLPDLAYSGGPFAACMPCPNCGAVEYHALRSPVRRTAEMDLILTAHPQIEWRSDRPISVQPWDEQQFEVIRECGHCRAEWGHRP